MNSVLQVWMFAVPVALAAIGESLGQRSGVLDIGLEGKMLAGAFAGALAGIKTGNPWLGLVAGLAVGLGMGLLQNWFALKLAADQVVVGAAVNLLALGATGTMFRGMFGQSGKLMSLPPLPRYGGVDAIMVLTVCLAPLLFLAIGKTRWGLAVRACGEYPKAVEAEGMRVLGLRGGATLIGAALGGLAGAYLSLGLAGSFAEGMTNGRGFVAIALVTFGRWNPIWVMLAALLMGYLESLQFTLQAKGSAIPHQLLLASPYIVALIVLIIAGKGTLSPAALGIPYRGDK